MQKVLSVIVGLVVLFAILLAVQMLGPVLHPIPPGTDPSDPAALGRWMTTAPVSVQALVVLAWFLSALGGAWIALRVSAWTPAAWIVALLGAAMAVANVFRFEHPLWMQVAAFAAPLLGGWLAIRLGSRARAAAPIAD